MCAVMGVVVAPNRAPDCKARPTKHFDCYDDDYDYKNMSETLNGYIKHLKTKHGADIHDTTLTVQECDNYLPKPAQP